MDKNLPKDFYVRLLQIGSPEYISGLFLELAKRKWDLLREEAKDILEGDIKWADENYASGFRRCIKIYLTAIDEDLSTERIQWIRNNLHKVDLHLTKVKGKDLPKDKPLKGSAYRKYAYQGLFQDYYYSYDYTTRSRSYKEAPQRYETSVYSDGIRLNIIELKSTLKEAEIYGLADVVGRLAYYLDAPRITFYLKGSNKREALRYFRRYIKRVIRDYAETEPDKFMEAMKHFLLSYTEQDSICKYDDIFRYNELLGYYLYFDFYENPTKYYMELGYMYNPSTMDLFLELKGRFEYRKDIWDNNLDLVLEIALKSSVKQIIKACYYILKDSPKGKDFIDSLDYHKLIALAHSKYEPMEKMFKEILNERLNKSESFNPNLMIALIASPNEEMHNYAKDYFARVKGRFSPADTADLLFLDNLEQWEELFRNSIQSFEASEFVEFIKEVINRADKLLKLNQELPENIRDILSLSLTKVEDLSEESKAHLFESVLVTLTRRIRMPQWLGELVEEVLFSLPYESLEAILAKLEIEAEKGWNHARNKRILALLEGIKNKSLPGDMEILDALSAGGSKMIKKLLELMERNIESLRERPTTLLLMMEADVHVLNKMAEEIFESLPVNEQRKLHAMVLDSPVRKVYSFGLKQLDLIYGERIPEQFIIQMLEHSAPEVKAYISDKIDRVLGSFEEENERLFMYYVRTLLLMPNRISSSKDRVYELIPMFVLKYRRNLDSIRQLLLEVGGSNSIKDSERALVTLARIEQEVMLHEG